MDIYEDIKDFCHVVSKKCVEHPEIQRKATDIIEIVDSMLDLGVIPTGNDVETITKDIVSESTDDVVEKDGLKFPARCPDIQDCKMGGQVCGLWPPSSDICVSYRKKKFGIK